MLVDLATQVGRRLKQALAVGALAPPERLCVFGELAGARGLLVGALAVLVELVLEPQSARGGPGIEGPQRRSADGDRLLEPVGGETRGALARPIKEPFRLPACAARRARRGNGAVRPGMAYMGRR